MKYDFDRVINRLDTGSLKWEYSKDGVKSREAIPMWVADMDFQAPPPILEALHRHVEHGVFGYSFAKDEVVAAVIAGLKRIHGVDIDPDWLVWLPGLVSGLHVVAESFAAAGEEVITFVPAYPPFLNAPGATGRRLITVELVLVDGERYEIDYAAFEAAITPRTKVFYLCNPHNPTGRLFNREELCRLSEICARHGVLICSDEIHCDLVRNSEKRHTPFVSLAQELGAPSLSLMAPSKTYNVAGLNCSFAIIPDANLRERLHPAIDRLPHVNALGFSACMAAYRDCDQWRAELLEYLRDNYELVRSTVAPWRGVQMIASDATYLAWLDCRQLPLDDPTAFFLAAGVALSDGADFGAPGFVRLNFASPRAILQEALQIMAAALGGLEGV